ncbi:MAG: OmpW family protein [Magnetospirillum sp.]|nr:OmpW family protein [Magnetospirillum sp.]
MKITHLLAAATLAVAAATSVQAAEAPKQGISAGDFLVRVRALGVLPQEKNDTVTANGAGLGDDNISVKNDYIPEVDFTYFVTDNIGLELIAGTSRHSVKGKDNLNGLDLGKVSLLPPTLTAQYHFFPKGTVKPYVGAGVNYTHFYGEKSGALNSIDYDDNFGWALQAGIDVAVADGWYVNVDVKKLWLSTDVKGDLGGAAVRTSVDLDPWLVGIGIGYRF